MYSGFRAGVSTSATKLLPTDFDVLAPDGSEVRILAATERGSMAHFRLPSGGVSKAVRHRTVEEIWYVLAGQGEMWRSDVGVCACAPGVSLTIPVGVAFQFRCLGASPFDAVAITMPPWLGEAEAEFVDGIWAPDQA